jgi:hypothetical protein
MKMKKALIIVLAVFLFGSCATTKNTSSERELDKKIQVDNLIQKIYQDTVKFNRESLVFTQIGRRNVNSYSMLYIVNGAYLYMLDIISSDKVVEFVDKILAVDNIKSIVVLPKEKAIGLGGIRAQNGIVAIQLKKEVKFNVAGLDFTKNNSGNNFSKRKDNELKIME